MPPPLLSALTMALATRQDFEARYGEGDERVEPLLEDASALILSEIAESDAEWVHVGDAEVPQAVIGVCLAVTYRVWSNPDALSSASLGEYSQAWADRSGEALRLTNAERRIIKRAAGMNGFVAATLESPYSGPRWDGGEGL